MHMHMYMYICACAHDVTVTADNIQNPESRIQISRITVHVRGARALLFWILVVWILDSGFWILDSGFWILRQKFEKTFACLA